MGFKYQPLPEDTYVGLIEIYPQRPEIRKTFPSHPLSSGFKTLRHIILFTTLGPPASPATLRSRGIHWTALASSIAEARVSFALMRCAMISGTTMRRAGRLSGRAGIHIAKASSEYRKSRIMRLCFRLLMGVMALGVSDAESNRTSISWVDTGGSNRKAPRLGTWMDLV